MLKPQFIQSIEDEGSKEEALAFLKLYWDKYIILMSAIDNIGDNYGNSATQCSVAKAAKFDVEMLDSKFREKHIYG